MTSPASLVIVDDESQNRRLLQTLLAPDGYVTRTAGSGEEALEAALEAGAEGAHQTRTPSPDHEDGAEMSAGATL